MIDWDEIGMVIGYSLLGLVIVGGIVGIFALQFAYILSQPVGLTYPRIWAGRSGTGRLWITFYDTTISLSDVSDSLKTRRKENEKCSQQK